MNNPLPTRNLHELALRGAVLLLVAWTGLWALVALQAGPAAGMTAESVRLYGLVDLVQQTRLGQPLLRVGVNSVCLVGAVLLVALVAQRLAGAIAGGWVLLLLASLPLYQQALQAPVVYSGFALLWAVIVLGSQPVLPRAWQRPAPGGLGLVLLAGLVVVWGLRARLAGGVPVLLLTAALAPGAAWLGCRLAERPRAWVAVGYSILLAWACGAGAMLAGDPATWWLPLGVALVVGVLLLAAWARAAAYRPALLVVLVVGGALPWWFAPLQAWSPVGVLQLRQTLARNAGALPPAFTLTVYQRPVGLLAQEVHAALPGPREVTAQRVDHWLQLLQQAERRTQPVWIAGGRPALLAHAQEDGARQACRTGGWGTASWWFMPLGVLRRPGWGAVAQQCVATATGVVRVYAHGLVIDATHTHLLDLHDPPVPYVDIEAAHGTLYCLDRQGRVLQLGDGPSLSLVDVNAPCVDLELVHDGRGGYLLEANGRVHAFGTAPVYNVHGRRNRRPWRIKARPDGSGYVVFHRTRGVDVAGKVPLEPQYRDFGWDGPLGVDLEICPQTGVHVVLDRTGVVHRLGPAPAYTSSYYDPLRAAAVDFELTPAGDVVVLTARGTLYRTPAP